MKHQNIIRVKIRRQYFNFIIYSMIALFPAVPAMIITQAIKENNFDLSVFSEMLEALPVVAVMWGIVLVPCAILSLLNRFFFGEVIGTVTEKGLFVDSNLILWEDISKISFNPLISRLRRSYTSITIYVNSSENVKSTTDVLRFPAYGLRKIKKYKPEIKVDLEKSGVSTMVMLLLAPTLLSVMISLIA